MFQHINYGWRINEKGEREYLCNIARIKEAFYQEMEKNSHEEKSERKK